MRKENTHSLWCVWSLYSHFCRLVFVVMLLKEQSETQITEKICTKFIAATFFLACYFSVTVLVLTSEQELNSCGFKSFVHMMELSAWVLISRGYRREMVQFFHCPERPNRYITENPKPVKGCVLTLKYFSFSGKLVN